MTATKTDLTVANTILAQLGGRRFVMMTGARNFVGSKDSLSFSVPSEKANKIRITLTPMDTYTVEAYIVKARGGEFRVIETLEDVYSDQLEEVFTSMTGLYTRF